jgi:hypothetical protein
MRILHLALVAGLLAIGAAFGTLLWLGTAPLFPAGGADTLAYAIAALALGPIVIGVAWARPRVPARRPDQPAEEFWEDPTTRSRVMLLWAIWDGGAILGATGTLLTGSLVPAAAGLMALALLITHGPGHLDRPQGHA